MISSQTPTEAKAWFITGASSGIGRELVLAALGRGDSVAALSRRTAPLDDLAREYPDRLLLLNADVADEGAVSAAVSRTVSDFGTIDIVANNAGYGLFGAVEEASDAQTRAIFDTNVFGVLNVLRATLPVLRAQGRGLILQGSSLYGQFAHSGVGMLAATKFAVEGLSEALAQELAPLGIKVSIVEPAATETPFLANLAFAEPIGDYDGTVRAVQKALGEIPAGSGVDPTAAVAALMAVVDSDTPPLRIALGTDGANKMREALKGRLSEMDDWASVAASADGN
ncbi:SDR family NAD(P)-dependent oxidoreductase [Arthrobacter sp. TMN-37]